MPLVRIFKNVIWILYFTKLSNSDSPSPPPPPVTEDGAEIPLPRSGSRFTFELPEREQFCFYENFSTNENFHLEFYVIKGGNNDVDVVFRNPKREEIYRGRRKTYEEVKFKVFHGIFEFCFINVSSFSDKQVHINLYPEFKETLSQSVGEKEKPKVQTALETSMESVHQHMLAMEFYQQFLQANGRAGFNVAEALNSCVNWYLVVITCGIILTGLGQVVALKKLFP